MSVGKIIDFIYGSIGLTIFSRFLAGIFVALGDMKSPYNQSLVLSSAFTIIVIFVMVVIATGKFCIKISFKNVMTVICVIIASLVLTIPAENMDTIIDKTAEYGVGCIEEYETKDELKSLIYEADNSMKCILTGILAEQALSAKIESGIEVDLEEQKDVYTFSNFMRKLGVLYIFIVYFISLLIMGFRGLLDDGNYKLIVIDCNKYIRGLSSNENKV